MNKDMIQRLSRYKNILYKLKSLGFVKVFSDNLGDAVGMSSALVRKDFATVGLSGNKRGGYRIDELIEKLNTILGKDEIQRIVIVGCGKIGTALINYHGFSREGIKVVAGFDIKPEVVNPQLPVPILDMAQLGEFVKKESIQVAIMTIPENAAAQVLEVLVASGVKGVLNFAPVQLKGTEQCFIQNINIALEIENLFYYVRFAQKTEELSTKMRVMKK
ncbi:MAG TPA: redox-sensing transcriptional repressor Rex [Verrucomicrobia bacterium]|nr:MAG: redox-sensing transcriptional repressor Rex [Lentisphaerae bacterium GWF2_57_35]HBA83602.1 redox-sensing transcriptional repressor Rex [Verrucomicrobiota bacterium]